MNIPYASLTQIQRLFIVDPTPDHPVFGSVSSRVSAVCGTHSPNRWAIASHSLGDWTGSDRGQESAPLKRRSGYGKKSVRPKGVVS